MQPQITSASLQSLLTFPFKDKDWQTKLLIAFGLVIACFLVPIIPAIWLMGYVSRILRPMLVDGTQPELPEWKDWGGLFVDGIKFAGVALIFCLPSAVLYLFGITSAITPAFASGLMNSGRIPDQVFPIFFFTGITLEMFGIYGSMLLGLIAFIALPPALCQMIKEDRFTAAFNVSAWWKVLRANKGGFFVAYVFVMGLGMLAWAASGVIVYTVVLCWLLPMLAALAGTYLYLAVMPFFAQAYYVGIQQQADHEAADAPESGTEEPETGAPDDKPSNAPNAAGAEPAGEQHKS